MFDHKEKYNEKKNKRSFKTLKLYTITGENRNVLKSVLTGFNSYNPIKIWESGGYCQMLD